MQPAGPHFETAGPRERWGSPQEVRAKAKGTQRLRRARSCFLPKPWFSTQDGGPPWGVPGVPRQQRACLCLAIAPSWAQLSLGENKIPEAQVVAGTPSSAPSPGSARPLVADR